MTNEPTTKTCTRCGKTFTGTIYLCAECEAELEKHEGEYGVKFNEPTTEEIVRALGNPETLDQESLYYWSKVAADRLESQAKENEISRYLIEMQSNVITELTARAESAERERDAAVAEIKESYAFSTGEDGEPIYDFALCLICAKKDKPECDCTSSVGSEFVWRGLPQEGEGK